MMQTRPLLILLLLLAYLPAATSRANPSSTKPNIVVIVADDLGWSDVGYHGAPFPTPHLDALCKQGVQLDQHYVWPTCTPTRVALLTGRYPSRFGNYKPSNDRVLPWDTVTLARTLGEAGYATMISGKWHLGSSPEFGPRKFGFDRSYGSLAGGCTPYSHLYKGGKKVWHRNDALIEEEGHVTDLIAEEAIDFIQKANEKPFFLYLPFTAPHDPFDEPSQYTDIVKHIDAGRRQYTASVVHMDAAIGRVTDALKESGHAENTLIVFFSDNGGTRGEGGGNYPKPVAMSKVQGSNLPLRGWKRDLYEGGIRVVAFAVWPGQIKPGTTMAHPISAVDWMPTLMHIAGQKPAKQLKFDGINILPLLTGEENQPDKRLLYGVSHTKSSYARYGDWKLIVGANGSNPQLFELSSDPYEKNNLAKEKPNIVEQLRELIRSEAEKDHDALPGK